MGRKKANNKGLNAASKSQTQISLTLREESTGKKQGNLNAQTRLKLDYMKDIAIWASVDAKIPPLGALYGRQLAASSEVLGIPPDPSLFFCERCESILEPGQNCKVRIEKNKPNTRHGRKKKKISTQNNVVYTCHFCSHRNIVRGTPEGHMKEICPPKAKRSSDSNAKSEVASPNIEANEVKNTVGLPIAAAVEGPPSLSSPRTPLPRPGVSLLESMRRKRSRSSTKKVSQSESSSADANVENSVSASKKRKRKSWTSLKDIVESSKNDAYQKLTNLTIPF